MDNETLVMIFGGISAMSVFLTFIIAKKQSYKKDTDKCNDHSERIKVIETKIPYLEKHFENIDDNITKIFEKLDNWKH